MLLLNFSALAGSPSVHISPKPKWLSVFKPYDKLVPLRSVENGYFYQLIEQQEQVETKANYYHVIQHIVSASGIQNGSQISVGFDPSFQRLDFHEITVWRNGKPQSRLSTKSFKIIADEKDLSRFIYQGSFSAYCILDDIRKGDKIEYAYTITGRNPILGNKFCKDIYMQQSVPVAHMYKTLIASASRKLNFKSFNKPPNVAKTNANGLVCYAWEGFQVPAGIHYTDQPDWATTYNYVQVSDFASWDEVANWALSINPPTTNFKGPLAKQIAQLKAETFGDRKKYFREAVKLVQDEIRYMGIETGEYSHRANRPDKVFNQRYGDCKDKALLLISILNAGGIPAYMVLINTDAKGKTDMYLPSAYAFDHVTVMATVNSKTVWVDPTISYQRGKGLNIYYPQYEKGLVLGPGTTELAIIPPSRTGLVDYHENYVIGKDTGKVELEVITKYTLNEADKTRNTIAYTGVAETEKNYLSYYQRIYPNIEAADSVIITDNEDDNELTTIERYNISGFFNKDTATGKLTAGVYPNYLNEQLSDPGGKAKYPRQLNYPCEVHFTTTIVLNNGWGVDKTETEISRDAYYFKSKVWASNNVLNLNYRFRYLQNYLPVEKLSQYKADVKRIKDSEMGYSFTYDPNVGSSTQQYAVNYWMMLAVIILMGIAGFVGYKIYCIPTPEVIFESGATFTPLGGWLIFVAIGFSCTILVQAAGLSGGSFFNLDTWNAHVANTNDTVFKCWLAFEILGNALLMCYTVFCLVLLLNRRDILPKFIIGFYVWGTVFFTLDLFFGLIILGETSKETGIALLKTIIASAIWIPYFLRSERVANTFIVPYPANNYRYDSDYFKSADNTGQNLSN
ncbi:MAG: DUF3857 domain-containing protein [Bacteroidota bacterium]